MLELKEVSKFYTNNGITNVGLSKINLKLYRNEIVAITGESGSGKSTLLNVISKIDEFDEGEIYYYGNETSYFSISDMDDFRKNKVGFIFQNYNIIDSYTVLDNVMIPLLLKGLEKEDAKVEAMLLIKRVGLIGREHHRGSKLSGGEKQRCVIARALASDCDILACDEPTGNLDSTTALEIIKLIKEVAKDKLVLIVTHNYPEIESIATRQLKMADGRVVEDIVYKEQVKEENKELTLDYKPLKKNIIWRLGLNNIIRTPKKTIITCLIYFIIAFCFLFMSQLISTLSNLSNDYSDFTNTFENRLFVYGKNGEVIDESLLKGYNYDLNDFSTQLEYSYSFSHTTERIVYANNVPSYKLLKGKMPINENEFILLYNSPNELTLKTLEKNIGEYLVFEVNNGTSYERFKLVGIASYKSNLSYGTYAAFCPKLQNILNKVTPEYSVDYNETWHSLQTKLVSGNSKPCIYIPSKYYNEFTNQSVYCDMYELTDYDIEFYGGNSFYIEIAIDSDSILEPYFASVYTTKSKIKKVLNTLDDTSLKVVYPNEHKNEDLGLKILYEVIAFIMIAEFSAYLIGIFFIVYVILSKLYRSRIKDYSILRTLGITKKDMSKVVNVEMLIIGFSITIFTFIVFNILVYSLNWLAFLRNSAFGAFIAYFVAMYIFTKSMAKRFNKRIFKFTVRESVRGDDDND